MTRRKWFRGLKMVVLVVVCALAVVAAILFAKSRPTPGTVELLAKSREAAKVSQDAERQRLEQARGKLPADAVQLREWTYDEGTRALVKERSVPRPDLVLGLAHALLSDDSGEKSGDTGTLKNLIDHARKAGTITPVEESLDLSRHSRDEVLSAIDAYLSGLPLARAEAAYESGVFAVRKSLPYEQGIPVSVLERSVAYRGVFEVRRGDVEKGLRSYVCSEGMRRALRESGGIYWKGDLWSLQRIADFAWREAPFTPEQRERVLASVSHPVPRERLLELLYADIDGKRASRDEIVAELRKQPLGTVGALVYEYQWNREMRKEEEHMRQLPALLAQAPAAAVPEMDRIHDEAARGNSSGVSAGGIVPRAATLHLWNARAETIREVVRIAFLLKDYKRAHGEYPKDVAALAPGTTMPPDPLDGKPLAYESDGKTFTIAFPKRDTESGEAEGRDSAGKADSQSREHEILSEARTEGQIWHAQE